MLKNYIKIAFRNLRNQPTVSFINIFGLAVAIGCCLLLFLFIRYETTFDDFHQNVDDIYLLVQNQDLEKTQPRTIALSPLPVGKSLIDELPEFKNYVRIAERHGEIPIGENKFTQSLTFADPSFLNVFNFPILHGSSDQLLTEPGQVILTVSAAEKYFAEKNPVGEVLIINMGNVQAEFVVSALIQDPPANSTIKFDVLLSMSDMSGFQDYQDDFSTSLVHTYVQANSSASNPELKEDLRNFVNRHWSDSDENIPVFSTIPLSSIHFSEDILFGPGSPRSSVQLYVMGVIALIILLTACVNFILLTLGRSAERTKEVGIRKVMGANRRQIMIQFWGETIFQITFSVGVGLGVAELLLPLFNRLASVNIYWDMFGILTLFSFTIVLVLGIALIAGIYPAVIQSGYSPIKTLTSKNKNTDLSFFGRSLIVFQYSLSIILIIGAVTIYSQLDFLKNKPLGYDGEQVVMIPTSGVNAAEYTNLIKDELYQNPGLLSVSGTSNSFTEGGAYGEKQVTIEDKTISTRDYAVNSSYIETMGIKLLDGRNFSESFQSDPTSAVIVNRAFIEELGLKEPVGKTLNFRGDREIIGVVENFHFKSLHDEITPLILHTSPGWPIMHVAVRLSHGQIQESLQTLEAKWKELIPGQTFEFHFLDEQMDQLYIQEEKWAEITTYAAILAIVIAGIGLLGLTSVTTENRKKEIGIRKVLGASFSSILILLYRNFTVLFGIAFIIAIPVSFIAVNSWLSNYAYHVDPAWWMFLVSGFFALLIAITAISYHSIKTALMNPVNSLRSE